MEYNRSFDNKTAQEPDGQRSRLDVSTSTQRIEPTLRRIAARLKRDFADQIARDPAGFKKRVVRGIRRELPPGPGRPNDP